MPDLLHLFHKDKESSGSTKQTQLHHGHMFSRSATSPQAQASHSHAYGSHFTQKNRPLNHAQTSPLEMSRSLPKQQTVTDTYAQQGNVLASDGLNYNAGMSGANNYNSQVYTNTLDNARLATSLNSQRIPMARETMPMSLGYAQQSSNDPSFAQRRFSEYSDTEEEPSFLFDKTLVSYLQGRGLLKSQRVSSTKDLPNCPLDIFVASQGENVFLPTTSSQDEEYLQQLNNMNEHHGETGATPSNNQNSASSTSLNRLENQEEHATEEQIMQDLENSTVAQKFAIIVSLKTRTPIKKVQVKLTGDALVYWYNGVPPKRSSFKEFYKISETEWNLDMSKYGAYINQEGVIKETNENNIPISIITNKSSAAMKKEPYLPLGYTRKQIFLHEMLKENSNAKFAKFYEPGNYIFFLPMYFANSHTESIYVPSARIKHTLHCGVMISNTLYAKELANNSSHVTTNNNLTASLHSQSPLSHSPRSAHETNSSTSLLSQNSSLEESTPPGHASSATSGGGGFFKKFIGSTSVGSHGQLGHHHPSNASSQTSLPQDLHTFYSKWGLIYGDKLINLVRIAPLRSVSTADKPIYINRVWNKSLAYEVSLPEKYIPLGSVMPIRIKLTPIDKTLSIKRIRVGVVEKITLQSKNLDYEFDQLEPLLADSQNPYYQEFLKKRKTDRCLSVLEVRACKNTGHPSMKEITVSNCKKDNLFQFYDKNIDAFIVNCNVEFPKFEPLSTLKTKLNLKYGPLKTLAPYGCEKYYEMLPGDDDILEEQEEPDTLSLHRKNSANRDLSPHSPERSPHGSLKERRGSTAGSILSGIFGKKSRHNSVHHESAPEECPDANIVDFLENQSHTHTIKDSLFSQSGVGVQFDTTLNHSERGLYTESVNSSNVHTKHKLEILLRLSKYDETLGKSRHFEVIIDTPICLLSELCVDDNVSLPNYTTAMMNSIVKAVESDESAPPPTFEEAISVPASPVGSPTMHPINKSLFDDDNSISNLSLTDSSNGTATPSMGQALPPTQLSHTTSNLAPHTDNFNNIDDLLHSHSDTALHNQLFNGVSQNQNYPNYTRNPRDMLPSYNESVTMTGETS
ncbi:hypothetical protein ACO0QE_004194 [Hanseniaspora vineae]